MINKYVILKNKYCYKKYCLNSVLKKDIEKIRKWRNFKIKVLRQDNYLTSDMQLEYYTKNVWSQMNLRKPKIILFSIRYNKKLIGYGGLVNISWEKKKAEISFLINNKIFENTKSYSKYFNIFFYLIQHIAFSELKFLSLYSETFLFRKKHIYLLEKFGFKRNYKKNKINSVFHSLKNDKKK